MSAFGEETFDRLYNPHQFKPKEPTESTPLFTREHEPQQGGGAWRSYNAYPSRPGHPDMVAESGVDMSVVDTPAKNAYAYPGPKIEPEPSTQFTATHETLTQVSRSTGQFYPGAAAQLVEMGERDIARHEWGQRRNRTYSGTGDHDMAEIDLHNGGSDGQQKLFGSHHIPGKSVVDTLFSTKEARIHAPALLAIAERDTQERFGHGLTASGNRSHFSEQLTQHLGALTGQEMSKRYATNDSMLFSDSGRSQRRESAMHATPGVTKEEISPGEVATGRRTVRGMVEQGRAAKKAAKNPPTPPEQQRLF